MSCAIYKIYANEENKLSLRNASVKLCLEKPAVRHYLCLVAERMVFRLTHTHTDTQTHKQAHKYTHAHWINRIGFIIIIIIFAKYYVYFKWCSTVQSSMETSSNCYIFPLVTCHMNKHTDGIKTYSRSVFTE